MADNTSELSAGLKITTKWAPQEFMLTINSGKVGFEDLQKLVTNVVKEVEPKLAEMLFKEWGKELEKNGRLDVDDFKVHWAAIKAAKAAKEQAPA